MAQSEQSHAIKIAGNVGIGTRSPQRILHIAATAPEFVVQETDAATDESRWRWIQTAGVMSLQAIDDAITSASTAITLERSGATVTEVNFPTGKVGIGTASPAQTLTVQGRVNISQNLTVNNSVLFVDGTSGDVGIGIAAPGAKLQVSGGNIRLDNNQHIEWGGFPILKHDGTRTSIGDTLEATLTLISASVGVNQTTPTSMLHVGSSNANADSLALRVQDADGNCYFNPESTDQPWTCSSDARLKENIKDAAPVLPYLLGIPIKDYTVIASGDNKTGVIAQELLEKYPELVHEDNDGYYMVDGINAWKLVKAIQELKAENDALKELVCLDHPDAEICKI